MRKVEFLFAASAVGAALAASVIGASVALAKGGKNPGAKAPNPGAEPVGRVTVLRADDKPVAGAQVALLNAASTDRNGSWQASSFAESATGKDGVAPFTRWLGPPTCLLAWKDGDCAFLCNEETTERGRVSVRLAPGTSLAGTLLLADGKPAVRPRLRFRFAGGYEWHHLDVAVADDGAFRVPPLPEALISGEATPPYFEVSAENVPVQRLDVGPEPGAQRLVIRGPRHVRGVVAGADGKPVAAAVVKSGNGIDGPSAPVGPKGQFDLAAAAADLGARVWIVSASHAPLRVDLPEGAEDADLGSVTLDPGRPVAGKVVSADGTTVERAFVTLQADDGFRVASCDAGPGGAFAFPHVGTGTHTLVVYVHRMKDTACWLAANVAVEAGDSPVEVPVHSGLIVRLVDTKGAPVQASEVRLEIDCATWPKQRTETLQAGPREKKFTQVRLSTFGPGTARVTVRVDGRGPFSADGIQLDASGDGATDIVVK